MELSWNRHWTILGHFGVTWRRIGVTFGVSLEQFWGQLGTFGNHVGATWEAFGHLGVTWKHFGPLGN